jgi:hypothetical protein
MRRLWLAVLFTCAIGSACGHPYASGADAPLDAGADSTTTDAATTDAATTDAATTDAVTTDADADAGSCSRVVDESFTDTATPIGWLKGTKGGGAVDLDTSVFSSGPGALRATVTSNPAAGQAELARTVASAVPRHVRVSFAMRIDQPGTAYSVPGCSLHLTAPGDDFVSLRPELYGGVLSVRDHAAVGGVESTPPPAKTVATVDSAHWYLFVMEFQDITTTTAHATVTVDNTPIYERDVTLPAPANAVDLMCGITNSDANQSVLAHVDDVSVELCN